VSTASEETRQPGRDLPIAIVGSLVIATVIYILVAVAAVGALSADQLAGQDAPLAVTLSEGAGIGWGADIVVRSTRRDHERRVDDLVRADARGLLDEPRRAHAGAPRDRVGAHSHPGAAHARVRDPDRPDRGLRAAHRLAELVNIGTLFAFFIVNIAVIWLRRTKPDMERGFRVPFVPVFPLIGAACACI
jgi:basic amino acid/polyamine antiporter, APA family